MINKTREPADKSVRLRRTVSIASMALFAVLLGLVFWYVGKPLLQFVSEPEQFRLWVDSHGIWGRLAFLGMTVLQIVVAIIPGEPLEIAAGYAFGIWEGTALCLLGILIGSAMVFLFVRFVGVKAVEVFFSREKIASLKFLRDSRRLNLLTFLLFFIPGTPKDILTYFIGLTPMKLPTFLLITCTARIPSVITSTIGGDALGVGKYTFAIIVFGVTGLLALAGMLLYRRYTRKKSGETDDAAAPESVDETKTGDGKKSS